MCATAPEYVLYIPYNTADLCSNPARMLVCSYATRQSLELILDLRYFLYAPCAAMLGTTTNRRSGSAKMAGRVGLQTRTRPGDFRGLH